MSKVDENGKYLECPEIGTIVYSMHDEIYEIQSKDQLDNLDLRCVVIKTREGHIRVVQVSNCYNASGDGHGLSACSFEASEAHNTQESALRAAILSNISQCKRDYENALQLLEWLDSIYQK